MLGSQHATHIVWTWHFSTCRSYLNKSQEYSDFLRLFSVIAVVHVLSGFWDYGIWNIVTLLNVIVRTLLAMMIMNWIEWSFVKADRTWVCLVVHLTKSVCNNVWSRKLKRLLYRCTSSSFQKALGLDTTQHNKAFSH